MTSPQRHDAYNDLPGAHTRSDMSLSPGPVIGQLQPPAGRLQHQLARRRPGRRG
jgi:hypothetical protein